MISRRQTSSPVHLTTQEALGKFAAPNRSGHLPAGDIRLTANIRADLHLALKIRAARERTTMGELIEQWVQTWKDDD